MTKTKLLIVEDEALVAMGVCREFKDLGYDVCPPAISGKQAIEIAEREQPDVMLVDIMLPGEMNGIEAAVEIRSRLGIPFAYITGYESQEIVDRALATNPIGFFLKPLNCQAIHAELDLTLAEL